ncbi:hypothetical protein [Streptomyces camelliae]|uniref:DUF5134 domain-containing protein n=1 Tax=Streptomyces camelliae TaxID=3004093 RepID=A0ABY7NWY6_9ACTN|nr:hypothetical protein [Streptomyces sp. HUAS 2-6]WBO62731.1 hypothetical protein O1G22_07825 [Streptomyces sp. HUAS 2-6]
MRPLHPRVFQDTGVVFGIGLLLMVVVHTALHTRSHGRPVRHRAVAAPLALATATAGVRMPVYGELLLLVAALTAMPTMETRHCAAAAPNPGPEGSGYPEAGPTGS